MTVLVSIAITPNPARIIGSGSAQLVATGTYSDASTLDITNAATWNSSSAQIAVDAAGLVTGWQFGGTAKITASIGDISGTASVSVKKTETKLRALLRILLTPFQDVENAIQQVLQISVTSSTGQTLTLLGKIVGQERNGITDDEVFRRYVRARIATNRSTMVGEDIIRVLLLVMGDDATKVVVNNNGDAAFEVTIQGVVVLDDLATILLRFLRAAAGVGIRPILMTWPAVEADMFAFSGGTGMGWGDALDAATGGSFASGRD